LRVRANRGAGALGVVRAQRFVTPRATGCDDMAAASSLRGRKPYALFEEMRQ